MAGILQKERDGVVILRIGDVVWRKREGLVGTNDDLEVFLRKRSTSEGKSSQNGRKLHLVRLNGMWKGLHRESRIGTAVQRKCCLSTKVTNEPI